MRISDWSSDVCSSDLLPMDAAQRFLAFQWLMFQMGGIGPMFGQTHHFRRFASGETYSLNRFTKETHRLYRVLDRQLEAHHYVAGSNYGLADIAGRKSTRLNSSHSCATRMTSSA